MKKQILIFFTLILTSIALPLYAFKVSHKLDYTDFDVYYRAATRAHAMLWEQIYTLSDGASPFRYAPALLLFLSPLAYLSAPTAKLLWYFLNFGFFSLGFYYLYHALAATREGRAESPKTLSKSALFSTCFAVLFVFRLCLDTFTIGQISGVMFFGFCLSVYGWMQRKPWLAGFGLLIPTSIKIGPGIIYSLFLLAKRKERNPTIFGSLLFGGILFALSAGWLGTMALTRKLWGNWVAIVQNDAVYYDASHYGSQSINSAILRLAKPGFISEEMAHTLFLTVAILGCTSLFLFWLLRRPRTVQGRGLFFSLGLFAYFWFMPETFKYSLTPLAIPVALLLNSHRKNTLSWFALVFGALTISLAGLDLVGSRIFFAVQNFSLPLMASIFLALALIRHAYLESIPSFFYRRVSQIFRHPKLGPWTHFPSLDSSLDVSYILPLPLEGHSPLNLRRSLSHILEQALLLSQIFPKSELILVPFGDRWTEGHPLLVGIRETLGDQATVKILHPPEIAGRGAALRQGFLASRGAKIFIAHLEQPCDFSFFVQAGNLLDQGYDLVRGNRRIAETRFDIPVKLLPLVYGRHRLGVWFNRLVRTLLPIHSTDTQSGIAAMRRPLALHSFAVQNFADFLFDLEFSLTAIGHGFKEIDLPVILNLQTEKSAKRVSYESLSILHGLPLLNFRFKRGCYHRYALPRAITADDWGISPGVNDGILKLAQAGIIRRVSMMADTKFLTHELEALKRLQARNEIELGLHFNLTYGKKIQDQNFGPGGFLRRWISHQTELTPLIQTELNSQLRILKNQGVKVSYLDGHHHIHILPGVLGAILPVLKQNFISDIRIPLDPKLIFTAKFPLVVMSLWAAFRAKSFGLSYRKCFYPQIKHFSDHGLMRAELAHHHDAEIIVHPALSADSERFEFPDTYTVERVYEYQALLMLAVPSE